MGTMAWITLDLVLGCGIAFIVYKIVDNEATRTAADASDKLAGAAKDYVDFWPDVFSGKLWRK